LHPGSGGRVSIDVVAAQQRSATFMRIRFGAVLPNLLRDFRAHLQCWCSGHG
jgi:hypothetical protein